MAGYVCDGDVCAMRTPVVAASSPVAPAEGAAGAASAASGLDAASAVSAASGLDALTAAHRVLVLHYAK